MSLLSRKQQRPVRQGRAAIDGAGEIERRGLHFPPKSRAFVAGVERQRFGVDGAVVDHGHVEIGIVGALEKSGERLAKQQRRVAIRNDDAHLRPGSDRVRRLPARRCRSARRSDIAGVRQMQDRAARRGRRESERERVVALRPPRPPAPERDDALAPIDGEAAEIVETLQQHGVEGGLQYDLDCVPLRVGDRLVGVERLGSRIFGERRRDARDREARRPSLGIDPGDVGSARARQRFAPARRGIGERGVADHDFRRSAVGPAGGQPRRRRVEDEAKPQPRRGRLASRERCGVAEKTTGPSRIPGRTRRNRRASFASALRTPHFCGMDAPAGVAAQVRRSLYEAQ